jgi:hypothetical protein
MEATATHPDVLKYREAQLKVDAELQKGVMNSFYFNLFLLKALPMGFIAGLKVKSLSLEKCEVTVPYRWLNKNPFQSTYFAVLAMAAEMSSGMMSMMGTYKSKPSVAVLVTGIEAEFVKKATTVTTFTCEDGRLIREAIELAIATGEGTTCRTVSTGVSKDGVVEARFWVTWSFKKRGK